MPQRNLRASAGVSLADSINQTVARETRVLRQSSEIIGHEVLATDGSIGTVADLLFDDRTWTLRWAVVDMGDWVAGRQVLLPPSAFGQSVPGSRQFPVKLTREQVENSPDLAQDEPVSRQKEIEIYSHYGWMPYFYPTMDPVAGAPVASRHIAEEGGGVAPRDASRPPPEDFGTNPAGDEHLRSINEVTEYYIHASDGDIGHVETFLIDDADWSVRYFVVDTRNWWPGRMVLVSTQWITAISWEDEHVTVDLTREQVKKSPEYDSAAPVERGYEERLHAHYDRPTYWP
jgi:hypothetical protein